MRVAYGHEIVSDDDPYVEIAKDSGYALTHCGPPGGTPVDMFPIRRPFTLCIYYPTYSSHSPAPPFMVPWHLLCYESKGVQCCNSEIA